MYSYHTQLPLNRYKQYEPWPRKYTNKWKIST